MSYGSNSPAFAVAARLTPLFVAALLLLAVPQAAAQAQRDAAAEASEQTATDQTATDQTATQDSDLMTVGVQGGRFGAGLASSWPAYGISGTMQVSEKLTAEAILGFFGNVSTYSARGWYRFNRNPEYDLYGYAGAGVYRYGYDVLGINENVLGLGAGIGVEASLAKLFDDEDFPPIFLNTELGLAYANFDYYNFSSLSYGFGIHYRFGGE